MFKPRFASIKDISEIRRLPRLGKIKLGVKLISQKTNQEYPKETEYFIVPPEIARVYGDKPTALEVMFPLNDREAVFPQAYKWYGAMRGLRCVGNGIQALRLKEETREMEEIECFGEGCDHFRSGECQRIGHLMVIIPRVNMGGVYQIDVGSYHSIVDVNSGIDYVQALVGRFAMVPLRLCRLPKETHYGGQKQIHYTLQLFFDVDVETLNKLREDTSRVLLSTRGIALPPPEIVDQDGVIIEENLKDLSEDKDESNQKEEAPARKEAVEVAYSSLGNSSLEEQMESKKDNGNEPKITKQQFEAIKKIAERKGVRANFDFLKALSFETASKIINAMQKKEFSVESFKKEFGDVIDDYY